MNSGMFSRARLAGKNTEGSSSSSSSSSGTKASHGHLLQAMSAEHHMPSMIDGSSSSSSSRNLKQWVPGEWTTDPDFTSFLTSNVINPAMAKNPGMLTGLPGMGLGGGLTGLGGTGGGGGLLGGLLGGLTNRGSSGLGGRNQGLQGLFGPSSSRQQQAGGGLGGLLSGSSRQSASLGTLEQAPLTGTFQQQQQQVASSAFDTGSTGATYNPYASVNYNQPFQNLAQVPGQVAGASKGYNTGLMQQGVQQAQGLASTIQQQSQQSLSTPNQPLTGGNKQPVAVQGLGQDPNTYLIGGSDYYPGGSNGYGQTGGLYQATPRLPGQGVTPATTGTPSINWGDAVPGISAAQSARDSQGSAGQGLAGQGSAGQGFAQPGGGVAGYSLTSGQLVSSTNLNNQYAGGQLDSGGQFIGANPNAGGTFDPATGELTPGGGGNPHCFEGASAAKCAFIAKGVGQCLADCFQTYKEKTA
jgi:hypothetical protein